jgi:hypothetical protein
MPNSVTAPDLAIISEIVRADFVRAWYRARIEARAAIALHTQVELTTAELDAFLQDGTLPARVRP